MSIGYLLLFFAAACGHPLFVGIVCFDSVGPLSGCRIPLVVLCCYVWVSSGYFDRLEPLECVWDTSYGSLGRMCIRCLWASPTCGHTLFMGVTYLWAYAVYGRHLLVGIRCLWASPTCEHTLFMGVTYLWAYAVYGRHLLVSIRCLWASPTCGHTLFMGVTYFDSVDLLIINFYDVPLVEFMYLVFTRMSVESNRRRLRFLLLYLIYVFRALTNSLVY